MVRSTSSCVNMRDSAQIISTLPGLRRVGDCSAWFRTGCRERGWPRQLIPLGSYRLQSCRRSNWIYDRTRENGPKMSCSVHHPIERPAQACTPQRKAASVLRQSLFMSGQPIAAAEKGMACSADPMNFYSVEAGMFCHGRKRPLSGTSDARPSGPRTNADEFWRQVQIRYQQSVIEPHGQWIAGDAARSICRPDQRCVHELGSLHDFPIRCFYAHDQLDGPEIVREVGDNAFESMARECGTVDVQVVVTHPERHSLITSGISNKNAAQKLFAQA